VDYEKKIEIEEVVMVEMKGSDKFYGVIDFYNL
jgi:hypothetical protein